MIILATMITVWMFTTPTAEAKRLPRWETTTSTWYGPHYYNHYTSCHVWYTPATIGVASMTDKCGTRVTLRRNGHTIHTKVIDTGNFHTRFDLSAKAAQILCHCDAPYTMRHQYHYGW